MITNETGLKLTLESIELMEQSIESMRRIVLPQSREWFDLMAEAPRDEIKRLRREIADYHARCKSAA